MTRSDFIIIATTIRHLRHTFKSNAAHVEAARVMAYSLADTNPRFDRAKFIMACMPTAWVGTNKANVWEREAAR